MAKSGGFDPQLRKRLLHWRGENGRIATEVEVDEFVMDDGVEIVALDSEAFDAAFGGKKNKELARETANYIEVLSHQALLFVTSKLYKSGINSHLN